MRWSAGWAQGAGERGFPGVETMFEGVLLYFLKKHLGEYVENLEVERLKVAVWRGDVQLRDLSLRRDALHRLGLGGLPLELRGGFIGGIMLQVPWRNLAGGRSCMVLEDVTVVVARPVWQSGVMAEGARVVAEKAAREAAAQAIRVKLEEVDAYFARKRTAAGERGTGATRSTRSEDATSTGEEGPGDERTASLYERLAYAVARNLEVEIRRIHVRYEDEQSWGAGKALACGVLLDCLRVQSCDGQWKVRSFSSSSSDGDAAEILGPAYKRLEMDALCAYCDTGRGRESGAQTSARRGVNLWRANGHAGYAAATAVPGVGTFTNHSNEPVHGKGQESSAAAATGGDAGKDESCWLLAPTAASARGTFQTGKALPRTDLSVDIGDFSLGLVEEQYMGLIRVAAHFAASARTRELRERHWPRGEGRSSRILWRYAMGCVAESVAEGAGVRLVWSELAKRRRQRKRYVALFKAKHLKSKGMGADAGVVGGKHGKAEAIELSELEGALSANDIIYYRSIAYTELKRDKAQRVAAGAPVTRTWTEWLWSGANKEDEEVGDLTGEDLTLLYQSVGIDAEAGGSAPSLYTDDAALDPRATSLRVRFRLERGVLGLRDRSGRGLVTATLRNVEVAADMRVDGSAHLHYGVDSFEVEDSHTTGTSWKTVCGAAPLGGGRTKGSSADAKARGDRLLSVEVDTQPDTGTKDTLLRLGLNPLVLIHSPSLSARIFDFFDPQGAVDLSYIQERAAARARQLANYTTEQLKSALENHARVDLRVDVAAPLIIVPRDIRDRNRPLLVADLGRFSMRSVFANSGEDALFDRYVVKLDCVQLAVVESDACLAGGFSKSGDTHTQDSSARPSASQGYSILADDDLILRPITAKVVLEVCAVDGEASVPRVKIGGNVAQVEIVLSETTLARASGIAASLVAAHRGRAKEESKPKVAEVLREFAMSDASSLGWVDVADGGVTEEDCTQGAEHGQKRATKAGTFWARQESMMKELVILRSDLELEGVSVTVVRPLGGGSLYRMSVTQMRVAMTKRYFDVRLTASMSGFRVDDYCAVTQGHNENTSSPQRAVWTNDEHRGVRSSDEDNGKTFAHDLAEAKLSIVEPTSSLFAGAAALTSCEFNFSRMHVHLTREAVARAMNEAAKLGRVVKAEFAALSVDSVNRSIGAALPEVKTNRSTPAQKLATAKPGVGRMKLVMNAKPLVAFVGRVSELELLVGDTYAAEAQVARMSIEKSHTSVVINDYAHISLKSDLDDIVVSDLTPGGGIHGPIISRERHREDSTHDDSRLIFVEYTTDSSACGDGFGALLDLQFSTVRIVYLGYFVTRLTSLLSHPSIALSSSALTSIIVNSESENSNSSRSSRARDDEKFDASQVDFQSRKDLPLRIKFSLDRPTLIMPAHSQHRTGIFAELGHIDISNIYEVLQTEPFPSNDNGEYSGAQDDGVVHRVSAELIDVNAGTWDDDDRFGRREVLTKTNIHLSAYLKGVAGMSIHVTVDPTSLSASEQQYDAILRTTINNSAESASLASNANAEAAHKRAATSAPKPIESSEGSPFDVEIIFSHLAFSLGLENPGVVVKPLADLLVGNMCVQYNSGKDGEVRSSISIGTVYAVDRREEVDVAFRDFLGPRREAHGDSVRMTSSPSHRTTKFSSRNAEYGTMIVARHTRGGSDRSEGHQNLAFTLDGAEFIIYRDLFAQVTAWFVPRNTALPAKGDVAVDLPRGSVPSIHAEEDAPQRVSDETSPAPVSMTVQVTMGSVRTFLLEDRSRDTTRALGLEVTAAGRYELQKNGDTSSDFKILGMEVFVTDFRDWPQSSVEVLRRTEASVELSLLQVPNGLGRAMSLSVALEPTWVEVSFEIALLMMAIINVNMDGQNIEAESAQEFTQWNAESPRTEDLLKSLELDEPEENEKTICSFDDKGSELSVEADDWSETASEAPNDALDANIRDLNSVTSINFSGMLSSLDIVIVDDSAEGYIPLLGISFSKTESSEAAHVSITMSTPESESENVTPMMSMALVAEICCYFYNVRLSAWEPVLEPWNLVMNVRQFSGAGPLNALRYSASIKSLETLNLNLSYTSVVAVNSALSSWASSYAEYESVRVQSRVSEEAKTLGRHASNFSPCRLFNFTGNDVQVWVGSSSKLEARGVRLPPVSPVRKSGIEGNDLQENSYSPRSPSSSTTPKPLQIAHGSSHPLDFGYSSQSFASARRCDILGNREGERSEGVWNIALSIEGYETVHNIRLETVGVTVFNLRPNSDQFDSAFSTSLLSRAKRRGIRQQIVCEVVLKGSTKIATLSSPISVCNLTELPLHPYVITCTTATDDGDKESEAFVAPLHPLENEGEYATVPPEVCAEVLLAGFRKKLTADSRSRWQSSSVSATEPRIAFSLTHLDHKQLAMCLPRSVSLATLLHETAPRRMPTAEVLVSGDQEIQNDEDWSAKVFVALAAYNSGESVDDLLPSSRWTTETAGQYAIPGRRRPGYPCRLLVLPPLELCSLVPFPLCWRLHEVDPRSGRSIRVADGGVASSGVSLAIHAADLRCTLALQVRVVDPADAFAWSDLSLVHWGHDAQAMQAATGGSLPLLGEEFAMDDGIQGQLKLRLENVQRPGASRCLLVYARYAAINHSGLNLCIGKKSTSQGAQTMVPFCGQSPGGLLAPGGILLLTAASETDPLANCACVRVVEDPAGSHYGSDWSAVIGLENLGSNRGYRCSVQPRTDPASRASVSRLPLGFGREPLKYAPAGHTAGYVVPGTVELGISVGLGTGPLKRTRIVHIEPRYVLRNSLTEKIRLRQCPRRPAGSSSTELQGPEWDVEPGETVPLQWPSSALGPQLQVALGADGDWSAGSLWCDVLGVQHFKVRSSVAKVGGDGGVRIHAITAAVTEGTQLNSGALGSACIWITIETCKMPPYGVVNATRSCKMLLMQARERGGEGGASGSRRVASWELLEPGESRPFVCEDPHGPRSLLVRFLRPRSGSERGGDVISVDDFVPEVSLQAFLGKAEDRYTMAEERAKLLANAGGFEVVREATFKLDSVGSHEPLRLFYSTDAPGEQAEGNRSKGGHIQREKLALQTFSQLQPDWAPSRKSKQQGALQADFKRLFHLSDFVVARFNCTLDTKSHLRSVQSDGRDERGRVTGALKAAALLRHHGRMYLTPWYLCFYSKSSMIGGQETVERVTMADIEGVEASHTGIFIRDAIRVHTKGSGILTFRGMLHRDRAMSMIDRLSRGARDWVHAGGSTLMNRDIDPGRLVSEVFVRGPVKVLSFANTWPDLAASRTPGRGLSDRQLALPGAGPPPEAFVGGSNISFELDVERVGLSVIDEAGMELLYCTAHQSRVAYSLDMPAKGPGRQSAEIKIGWLQIDNSLLDARCPVLLRSRPSPESAGKPVVHVSCVERIDPDAAIVSKKGQGERIRMFEYVSFGVQEFSLELEEAILAHLMLFYNSVNTRPTGLTTTAGHIARGSGHTQRQLPVEAVQESQARSEASREVRLILEDFFDVSRKDLLGITNKSREGGASLAHTTSSERKSVPSDLLYIATLMLHPVRFTVGLKSSEGFASNEVAQTGGQGGRRSRVRQALQPILGSGYRAIMNIERARLSLNALKMMDVFSSSADLYDRMYAHYSRAIRGEMYKIMGSFDLLGDPVGLLEGVTTGIKDFFYEPSKGIVESPEAFVAGLTKGSASLVGHTVGAALGSASKVTGSLSQGVAALAMDDSYERRRASTALRSNVDGIGSGIAEGSAALATGIAEGIAGLIYQPVKAAEHGGIGGFALGLGKGLAGLVSKPVAGVLDFASKTSEGVRASTSSVLGIGPGPGGGLAVRSARIRLPRASGPHRLIKAYSEADAAGQVFFSRIQDGMLSKHQTYLAHNECSIEGKAAAAKPRYSAGRAVVFVTDQNILVFRVRDGAGASAGRSSGNGPTPPAIGPNDVEPLLILPLIEVQECVCAERAGRITFAGGPDGEHRWVLQLRSSSAARDLLAACALPPSCRVATDGR